MQPTAPTPRFVTCTKDPAGKRKTKEYNWDQTRIHVDKILVHDYWMLQNVFEGKIISPSIYPLIYETKSDEKEICMRSLEFYREVKEDPKLYKKLSQEEKTYFRFGLRDLFMASVGRLLDKDEEDVFRTMVDLVDPDCDNSEEGIICKIIDNLKVTPYPTKKNKMVRFVNEKAVSAQDEYFLRNELGFMIMFVDPQDLSFHNFENIINLDSLFSEEPDQFLISNFKKHPEKNLYKFDMIDKKKILVSLNDYGLYAKPFNQPSRGGERFLFSSDKLSKSLTDCIIKCIADKELSSDKFQFVNYVFRYNKFLPNDQKFTSHFDTPYYDPANKHYSKYTLLLYLTSGTADPVLSIDKQSVRIRKIDTKGEIAGVIFDQKYEHEGKAYIDNEKIFLRSDLIFSYDEKDQITFDPEVSKKFNIACYMTKESIYNNELEKYASECFNQAAEARVSLAEKKLIEDFLVHKRYKDIDFVTNGYDYWFTKDISLDEAAIMVILDYFNCKSESGVVFNKLTYNKVIRLEIKEINQILKYLNTESNQKNSNKEEEHKEEIKEEKQIEKKNKRAPCCETHYRNSFSPYECADVLAYFDLCKKEETTQINNFKEKFVVCILGEDIEIDKDRIKLTADNYILFDNQIPVVNFAGCWNGGCSYQNFVAFAPKILTGYTNMPPIPFKIYKDGYHLRMELFNNSFVRKGQERIKGYSIVTEPLYWGYGYDPITITDY